MTLSNITDRGTLRGVIYRGTGSGTSDYTQLSNKPQINGHTLQGNQSGDDLDLIDKGSLEINEHTLEGSMTGDDLGLVNSADLKFNVGYAGNILHNIKYKNNTYTTYAAPYSGATSGQNGTMGLVPAPLSSQGDDNKFLKGNGRWSTIPTNTPSFDTLYSFTVTDLPNIINLNYNWTDYDVIIISVIRAGETHYNEIYLPKLIDLIGNSIIMLGYDQEYVIYGISSDLILTKGNYNGTFRINKIIGLKFS